MADPLETYLADHLAGADAAVDLLGGLAERHPEPVAGELREIRAEVEADRHELESLMHRLGYERGRLRSAGARVAERISRLKLGGTGGKDAPLHLLEALDGLQSGIEGKRALWRALAAASEVNPALRMLDYAHLAGRAESQRDRVDAIRQLAARAAFGPG